MDSLPDDALVLDVGGWAQPDPRADWVLDIGAYESRNWYRTLGAEIPDVPERFTRETWVQADMCVLPWPFADDMFDYVICSQTLEDVRDPIGVCAEMSRVARAGYIETPPAAVELTRGIESPLWCGWRHHRWLVRDVDGELVFLAKPHHIHNPFWPSIRSPRLLRSSAAAPLAYRWSGSIPATEELVVGVDELDHVLLGIVAGSALPDARGALTRNVTRGGWRAYRAVRSTVGKRLHRARG
jgi:SAM-dependent methyltransferase